MAAMLEPGTGAMVEKGVIEVMAWNKGSRAEARERVQIDKKSMDSGKRDE